MRWKLVASLIAAGVFGSSVAYSAGFTLSAPPKIAFLYFADKTDGGWTQAFDEARPKMEAALGQKIPFVENVPEIAGKITPAAETFISRGSNIVIGTAFGYSDTFKELSEKYPKVAFLNASGTTNGPNLEVVLWPDLSEPISLRHGRGRYVKERQAWFCRRAPDRPGQLDNQCL